MALRLYLDTSVIVSLFCGDSYQTRATEALSTDEHSIVVSDWTTLEFVSVVARLRREKRFTHEKAVELLATYNRWIDDFGEIIMLSPLDLAISTSWLSEMKLNLRGPDAIHIAVAKNASLPMLTFDRKMVDAARMLDVVVIEG
ncbi:MAG: type II toxin-antitoxin system VapC family toxin [Bosea sp. (in: a-proteobacteria)]